MKNKIENLNRWGKFGLYAVILVILAGLLITGFVMECVGDKEPPVIQFPEKKVVYIQGDDYGSLLENVIVIDEQDGDVSDTLIIENIYPDEQSGTATVVYVARDSQNNVVKKKLVVDYFQKADSDFTGDDGAEDSGSEQESDRSQESSTDISTVEESSTEESSTEESSTEEVRLDSNPRIELTRESVTINSGDSINRISFVKSVSDDKDDEEYLSKRIQITGDQFDRNKPGIYEQVYYVIDSDGNKSNEEILIITVK